MSLAERVQVVNGRLEGLHERSLIHEPDIILKVVGQRFGVTVEDEPSNAATANAAAVIVDDVGV